MHTSTAKIAPWITRTGKAVVLAGCGFLLLVLVLQFLRDDLPWWRAQLSKYRHGPYGLVLRVGYCALAAAMAALALALYRALLPCARSVTVVGLFWCSALGMASVAIGDSYLPGWNAQLAPKLHVLFALIAFLCVIAAILLQSWYFRRDWQWRRHWRSAFVLALLGFCALAAHAGDVGLPRGLGQKLAIVLIVLWLVRVGGWLGWPRSAGAVLGGLSRDNARVIQRNGSQ